MTPLFLCFAATAYYSSILTLFADNGSVVTKSLCRLKLGTDSNSKSFQNCQVDGFIHDDSSGWALQVIRFPIPL